MDQNSPMMMRYLVDALRQRSLSPEPMAGFNPQQLPPMQPPPGTLGGGAAEGAAETIRQQQMERQRMLEEMGRNGQ
jgi:hypothetical protein